MRKENHFKAVQKIMLGSEKVSDNMTAHVNTGKLHLQIETVDQVDSWQNGILS